MRPAFPEVPGDEWPAGGPGLQERRRKTGAPGRGSSPFCLLLGEKGEGPFQGDPRQSWGDGGGGQAEPSATTGGGFQRGWMVQGGVVLGLEIPPPTGVPLSRGAAARAPVTWVPPRLRSAQHHGVTGGRKAPRDPAAAGLGFRTAGGEVAQPGDRSRFLESTLPPAALC